MTKNWSRFPLAEPVGEDLANFSVYELYEKAAISGFGVLSGCIVTRTDYGEVAAASGVISVNGVSATFAGVSLTGIAPAAAGLHRYDLVYIDGTDSTLKIELGVEEAPDSASVFLENYHPRPAEPTDTDWIALAILRVTESGLEEYDFGTINYAQDGIADMRMSPPFAVDNVTLQVVGGVASVKPAAILLASGATPLTASWDAGSFQIQAETLKSDVATGTAPLVVASTTQVTNLNADTLDGFHYTSFVKASGATALTANWDAGPYEIRAETLESDVATGTAPFTIASTTKVINLNADTLDGLHDVSFVKAAGTVALTGNWDAGSFQIQAETFKSDVTTGTAPLVVASTTVVSNLNADLVDGKNEADFAPVAKGVTNGDSHDHTGGDGAAIPSTSTTFTATSKILGRKTTAGGAGEECTLSEILDFVGSAAEGDLLLRGASTWSRANAATIIAAYPAHYERSRMWANKGSDSAANCRTLVTPDRLTVNINNVGYALLAALELDLDADTGVWDTLVGTDYSTAANRAGKDFYVYACTPVHGSVPVILVSAATTYPSGYAANTSRKIGGFHCECYAVGTIAGHALTDYLAGDILPRSVWDLQHRSAGLQVGMVWAGKTDFDSVFYGASIWVAIYLASGTGASTTSVNGGTISDTRNWMDFVDDFAAIGCRMLDDDEFQAIAAGSNEESNIATSADPGTTGGHTAYELLTLDVAPGGAGWAVGDYIIGATSTKSCKIVEVLSTTTYIVKNRTGAFTLNEVLTNSELLTLDVAPANPYWVAGNTITGASSGKTCVILEVLTNLTYLVKLRNGNFTAGEILSNGTTTADQGGAHPTVTTTITADQGAANPTVALNYTHCGRMVSHIGCEDCCGTMYQWLRTQSYQEDSADNWGWCNLPGAKGSLYNQDGAAGIADVKLLAGHSFIGGIWSGSRCRYAGYYSSRSQAFSSLSGRFCSEEP